MPTEPSKYAQNQFEVATRDNISLTGEILSDTIGRLVPIATAKPALGPSLTALQTANAMWVTAETVLANAEAALPSATALLEDKLASLTRKPDLDNNSLLESWDSTIRAQVAYNGSTYLLLLPQGRETVTVGTIEQRLDALRDFGVRLSQQATKPTLVALGTTVTTFATSARALRTAQLNAKGALELARANMEPLRLMAVAELFAMVGVGMGVFKATPDQVDSSSM